MSQPVNKSSNDANKYRVDKRVPRVEHPKRKTKRRQNGFSSRADSAALREYQRLAAMYPPLSHEQLIVLSKRFCRGRNAKSLIDEYDICDNVVDGDWDNAHVIACRDTILREYSRKIREYRENITLKDIADQWNARYEHVESNYDNEMQIIANVPKHKKELERAVEKGNEALAAIIDHNLQLAMSRISKLLHNSGREIKADIEDMIGAANLGLVLGARQFDPYKGRKFSTYVAFHIDGQLYALLDSENNGSGMTGMSPHEQKQLNTIVNIAMTFEDFYGRLPTTQELYSLTGIKPPIIKERLTTPRLVTQSLYEESDNNGDDNQPIINKISSNDTIEEEFEREKYDASLARMIEAIKELPIEYQKIITGRSGVIIDNDNVQAINKPKTNRTVSRELGISPSKTKKKYSEALDMLKNKMRDSGYDEDVIID